VEESDRALAATLFYRVRIVLDGVPRHAWLPDIVERLVGRTCALQCIDTNLLHPSDTRGIELWAWTGNPSRIPKVMWLTFTTSSMDGSSLWQVSETPTARWQRGIRHRVCVHLWEIHNYANVASDPHDPDIAIGEPEKRRLPWFWGVPDGEPAPTPAFPRSRRRPLRGCRNAGTNVPRRNAATASEETTLKLISELVTRLTAAATTTTTRTSTVRLQASRRTRRR
jgi:hypothetical protein